MPMDFNSNKPIYRQIIDLAFSRILSGMWEPEAKVPSVRELAVEIAVNTHTVLKAYEYLQAHGIIIPRRGMGFFLATDAPEKVLLSQREEFFEQTLPLFARQMEMLGLTLDDIANRLP